MSSSTSSPDEDQPDVLRGWPLSSGPPAPRARVPAAGSRPPPAAPAPSPAPSHRRGPGQPALRVLGAAEQLAAGGNELVAQRRRGACTASSSVRVGGTGQQLAARVRAARWLLDGEPGRRPGRGCSAGVRPARPRRRRRAGRAPGGSARGSSRCGAARWSRSSPSATSSSASRGTATGSSPATAPSSAATTVASSSADTGRSVPGSDRLMLSADTSRTSTRSLRTREAAVLAARPGGPRRGAPRRRHRRGRASGPTP